MAEAIDEVYHELTPRYEGRQASLSKRQSGIQGQLAVLFEYHVRIRGIWLVTPSSFPAYIIGHPGNRTFPLAPLSSSLCSRLAKASCGVVLTLRTRSFSKMHYG
jgi:hypothetical protein